MRLISSILVVLVLLYANMSRGKYIAAHFLQSMEEGRVLKILDKKVLEEGSREEIVVVSELAQRCLRLKGRSRPTMKEVAAELEGVRAREKGLISRLQHENSGFHSVEIAEDYNFSLISDNTTFNFSTITEESSDSRLLLDKS